MEESRENHEAIQVLSESNPLWLYSEDDKYIQGIRSGRQECLKKYGQRFLTLYRKVKSESCSVVSESLWPHGLYTPWNSLGQNTGVGSLSLLQGIFPTQGSSPDLMHFRWILYQLNQQGSPQILEWVAYQFFRGSSWPRNQTGVFFIAGRLSSSWATRETPWQIL